MAIASGVGYPGPACPHCAAPLRLEAFVSGPRTCLRCGRSFRAVRFEPAPVAAAPVAVATEASAPCARHPGNPAEAACQRCGQFMCSLCRIDSDAKAYCPACFERLSSEGALASTVTRIRNYSGLANMVLIAGFLTCWLGLPLGIYGIVLCVKGLKDKGRRGDTEGLVGLVVQLVLSILLLIMGLAVPLAVIFSGRRR